MNKRILISILIIFDLTIVSAQTTDIISIPEFNDNYSNSVKLLESGKTDIDYKEFRESLLESEQFSIILKKRTELRNLKKELYKHISVDNNEMITSTSKKILNIDYTDLKAHKTLRQTLEITGDTLNAKKYKTIQFGLLKSIVNTGDGKTCETSWDVIQISEEKFILEMLDAKLLIQQIDYNGGICDKMDVEINGKEKSYYFGVSKLLAAKQKLRNE